MIKSRQQPFDRQKLMRRLQLLQIREMTAADPDKRRELQAKIRSLKSLLAYMDRAETELIRRPGVEREIAGGVYWQKNRRPGREKRLGAEDAF